MVVDGYKETVGMFRMFGVYNYAPLALRERCNLIGKENSGCGVWKVLPLTGLRSAGGCWGGSLTAGVDG